MAEYEVVVSGLRRGRLRLLEGKALYAPRDLQTRRPEPERDIEQLFGFPLPLFAQLAGAELSPEDGPKAEGYRFVRARLGGMHVWRDMAAAHGALDVLEADGRAVGAMFTTGQTSVYIVEEKWLETCPAAAWSACAHRGRGVRRLRCTVETEDGVKLNTLVALPASLAPGEALPTILTRTCYGAEGLMEVQQASADRGYAVVVQDVRGTSESTGTFMPYLHEKDDAAATLRFLRLQPWYGGRAGVMGASFMGYTAWAAMAGGAPDIRAAVSLVTAGSPFYGDADRKNGAYSATCMMWDVGMSLRDKAELLQNADWEQAMDWLPIGDIPRHACGQSAAIWDEYMRHPDFDDFWEQMGLEQHAGQIDVPTLYLTGYHEGCIGGTMEMWRMNEREGRQNQCLICGPWYHDFDGNRTLPGERLSASAVLVNPDLLYEKWFDRWLKGKESKQAELPPVTFYIEGANAWRRASSFEEGAYRWRLYLGEQGRMRPWQQPSGSASYQYDPAHATPQVFEEDEYLVPADYSEVEKRGDMLTFTSEPLRQAVALVGGAQVVLYVSSSAPDTDFVARLTIVSPSGASRAVASQIIRAKYHQSIRRPALLEPEQVYRLELALPWAARLLRQGDALRLQVCSAAKGDYFPNLNTGADPCEDTGCAVACQTVHFGPQNASHVEVFLLDRDKIDMAQKENDHP